MIEVTNLFLHFQLLYGQLAIHMFFDPVFALDIIKELNPCYKEMMKSIDQKEQSKEHEEEQEEELYWVDVVTELLLSLMSRGAFHLRYVAKKVFG